MKFERCALIEEGLDQGMNVVRALGGFGQQIGEVAVLYRVNVERALSAQEQGKTATLFESL